METSWFKNKMVLCGPFVGSIDEELMCFRPFVYWLRKYFNFQNFIISTHYDRKFLYDVDVLPIFRQYTNLEKNQKGHKHKNICSKDYNFLINELKDQISKISKFNKGDIVVYNLGYSSLPNIYFSQRHFTPISFLESTPQNDKILFIPDNSRPKKELKSIYEQYKYYVDVVGDEHTYFKNLRNPNVKGYESIIKEILGCKMVITPCCHWTFLCNLHGVPVFSWGKHVSLYKGIYNFNNKMSMIIPFQNKNKEEILIKSINMLMEKI